MWLIKNLVYCYANIISIETKWRLYDKRVNKIYCEKAYESKNNETDSINRFATKLANAKDIIQ